MRGSKEGRAAGLHNPWRGVKCKMRKRGKGQVMKEDFRFCPGVIGSHLLSLLDILGMTWLPFGDPEIFTEIMSLRT